MSAEDKSRREIMNRIKNQVKIDLIDREKPQCDMLLEQNYDIIDDISGNSIAEATNETRKIFHRLNKLHILVNLIIVIIIISFVPINRIDCLRSRFGTFTVISAKPCHNALGQVGTCMFMWDCIKSEGQHLGTCSDRFLFGSCCHHNTTFNDVDIQRPNATQAATSTSTTLPMTTSSQTDSTYSYLNRDSYTTTPTTSTTTSQSPTTSFLQSSSSLSAHLSNLMAGDQNQNQNQNQNQRPQSASTPSWSTNLMTGDQQVGYSASDRVSQIANPITSTTTSSTTTTTSTTSTTTTMAPPPVTTYVSPMSTTMSLGPQDSQPPAPSNSYQNSEYVQQIRPEPPVQIIPQQAQRPQSTSWLTRPTTALTNAILHAFKPFPYLNPNRHRQPTYRPPPPHVSVAGYRPPHYRPIQVHPQQQQQQHQTGYLMNSQHVGSGPSTSGQNGEMTGSSSETSNYTTRPPPAMVKNPFESMANSTGGGGMLTSPSDNSDHHIVNPSTMTDRHRPMDKNMQQSIHQQQQQFSYDLESQSQKQNHYDIYNVTSNSTANNRVNSTQQPSYGLPPQQQQQQVNQYDYNFNNNTDHNSSNFSADHTTTSVTTSLEQPSGVAAGISHAVPNFATSMEAASYNGNGYPTLSPTATTTTTTMASTTSTTTSAPSLISMGESYGESHKPPQPPVVATFMEQHNNESVAYQPNYPLVSSSTSPSYLAASSGSSGYHEGGGSLAMEPVTDLGYPSSSPIDVIHGLSYHDGTSTSNSSQVESHFHSQQPQPPPPQTTSDLMAPSYQRPMTTAQPTNMLGNLDYQSQNLQPPAASTSSNQVTMITTTKVPPTRDSLLPTTTLPPPISLPTKRPQVLAKEATCGVTALYPQTKVVGGKNAAFGAWPWQVSVRKVSFFGYSSTHRCGGAVISNEWIATAGHCVDDLALQSIRIRVGEYDFSSMAEPFPYIERAARRKVVHPKYNFYTYENDLALVQLDQPIQFPPHVAPICLPPDNIDLLGRNATVTGWGRLNEGGTLPTILQEVRVPIVSNDKCKDMFFNAGRPEYIPDIFLCAGYEEGGRDSCQGDSGGPLQVKGDDGKWFLAGIISWGIGCAEQNLPGVCTRISRFKLWIQSTMSSGI